ncbi:MAG: hypothetical protein HN867_11115 [Deltaproteobacteria bacterium]|nr:hypothetical protein [Deltaproteobacteria bacterium]
MVDLDSHKHAINYLRQIRYQKQKNVACQSIQDQWQQILAAGGQQNLIGLAKLRQKWNTDLDTFLANHTYPRNISSIYDYSLQELEFKDFTNNDLQKAYQKLPNNSFRKKLDLVAAVRKQLRRNFEEDELEFLEESIQSKWVGRCLNLIVYDASLQQAFRLEQETYIKLFQRLLPRWDLVEIRCQISDPQSFRRDEENLKQLKENWSSLASNFSQIFSPGFIHRPEKNWAILFCYGSQEAPADWEQVKGKLWLELHQKFPAILASLTTIGLLRQKPSKNLLVLKKSLGQFDELIKVKLSLQLSKSMSTQECNSSVISILQKLHQKSLLKVSE